MRKKMGFLLVNAGDHFPLPALRIGLSALIRRALLVRLKARRVLLHL